ncbi:MAG: fused MFS/spermidine synthase [Rhizobiales bacterium]|nr:fused MFS/spermidine synthase [Hyphomicrobiales bacterium]
MASPEAPAQAADPQLPAPRRAFRLLGLAGLAAAGAAVLAAALWFWPQETAGPAPGIGNDPGLVTKVESLYNDIYVYRQDDGDYLLSFGAKRLRYIESIIDPKDELALPVAYTQSMTTGLAYAGELKKAMIIGLGGGRTAWYHHKSVPGMKMTAVELDPAVVDIAGEYFKVRPEPGFDIVVEDGRVFLTRSQDRYDIILVDAYRGPFVPFHLLTSEFYRLVAEHLAPGGVAVQNVEPSTMLFDPAVATIRSAFDHVVFVAGEGNIVILAYNGPEKDEAALKQAAAARQAQYHFRYDLTQLLNRRFTPRYNARAAPLTDDFAPVEYLKAIARHNEKQAEE